jgi:hypothetical protein
VESAPSNLAEQTEDETALDELASLTGDFGYDAVRQSSTAD